jgi:predicted metal-dependent hydrolase
MERRDAVDLGGLHAEVVRKSIKHVHLSVQPPDGRVRISAPQSMALDTIRLYAMTRLGWIKSQQHKIRSQERETPREYLDRESHSVWGKRYLLKVIQAATAPRVKLTHSTLELHVDPGGDSARHAENLLERWYKAQIKAALPPLLEKWQTSMGVQVDRLHVQRMKTKWGSCNPKTRLIRLNTDLARKPRACLEYILVHELAHLIEPTHNAVFQALMDRFMPDWRDLRNELNRLPLRHEDWGY